MAEPRWRPHTDRMGKPKVRYATMDDAFLTAQRLADSDLFSGDAFKRTPTAYECSDPGCDGFHVGNWSDQAFRGSLREGT